MHSWFINEVNIRVVLQPASPVLIKAGGEGAGSIDPTLPDMCFVRSPAKGGDVGNIYIPGSSFRGVLRSHAERLVRALFPHAACDILHDKPSETTLHPACTSGWQRGVAKLPGNKAYEASCYACRLFGNTGIGSKVRVSDFHLTEGSQPQTAVRYGVAIDRVTGAVAHGPFEMEVLTDGTLEGTIQVRNFTLGQLGLVSAALLDIAEGLVPIGYGKSRGLGRVRLDFPYILFRYLRPPAQPVAGIEDESLVPADSGLLAGYRRPKVSRSLTLELPPPVQDGLFYLVQVQGGRRLLEACAPLWVTEVEEDGR